MHCSETELRNVQLASWRVCQLVQGFMWKLDGDVSTPLYHRSVIFSISYVTHVVQYKLHSEYNSHNLRPEYSLRIYIPSPNINLWVPACLCRTRKSIGRRAGSDTDHGIHIRDHVTITCVVFDKPVSYSTHQQAQRSALKILASSQRFVPSLTFRHCLHYESDEFIYNSYWF